MSIIPMIETLPLAVAATIASSTCLDPLANLSNSNTPTGLWTQICRRVLLCDSLCCNNCVERVKLSANLIYSCYCIFHHSPVGVFEFDKFASGSKQVLEAIVAATAKGSVSIIGMIDISNVCLLAKRHSSLYRWRRYSNLC